MRLSPKASRATDIRIALARDIESGRLAPGSALDERALAERFEVSRTPVREALAQLAAQNLVTIAPRHGVVVSRLTIPQLRAMLELLGELEALCAKYCARRMDARERKALLEAVRACNAAAADADTRQYIRENVRFHSLIHAACHNPCLSEHVAGIHRQIRRYRTQDFQAPLQMTTSAADHGRIADAILVGDEARAQDEMLRHVPAGSTGFAEFLSKVPAGFFERDDGMALPRSLAVI